MPVTRAHFGLLTYFADQTHDEARLVDQAQVAEKLDFGLDVHPAGKKSMGLVAVRGATSFGSNLKTRMRARSFASNSGSFRSLDTLSAAAMPPPGAMETSTTS